MKIIRPFIVSDVSLVSSTVSAIDPNAAAGSYNAGTTYALADVIQMDSPPFTFTASGAILTAAAHGWSDNTLFKASSSGTLPPGMLANQLYYMVQTTTNSLKFSLTRNGPSIITTGAGTGTHTATVSSHKVYESLQAGNIGHTPHKSPTWWLDLGNTNRWDAFDQSITSQVQQADSMTYVIQTTGRTDSVALLNLNASEVVITARESGGGAIVYGPVTYDLRHSVSVSSFWAWFFEPITKTRTFVDIDLPPYSDLELTITLNDTGSTVGCGAIICGLSMEIGDAQYGASLGIMDYSVKAADAFGNYTITERAFSKRGNFQLMLDRGMVDGLQQILEQFRATPAVYVGAPGQYESTTIYGFFKDFSINIAYPTKSLCSIDIEGLT